MIKQIVRQLGNREDEHEVEEQFERTDAVVGYLAIVAEMGGTRHRRIRRMQAPETQACRLVAVGSAQGEE
jgi:hypothetical protein